MAWLLPIRRLAFAGKCACRHEHAIPSMESIMGSKYGEFKLVFLKRVYQQGWPHSCWDHHMLGYLVHLPKGPRTGFAVRVRIYV